MVRAKCSAVCWSRLETASSKIRIFGHLSGALVIAMRCPRERPSAAPFAAGGEGVRRLRDVEDVAEASDGDAGLLERLPQADEAQARRAHPAGELQEG